jgi:hypothetical protein
MSGPIVIPPPTGDYADLSDAASPTWLNGPNGQRFRFGPATCVNGLADGAGYAVLSRYPDWAPSDAFTWVSQDRTLPQGFAEPLVHYVDRLKQWLDIHAWDGLPTGLLMAVLSYVYPVQPKVLTVSTYVKPTASTIPGDASTTTWYTYSPGTEPMPYPSIQPTAPAWVATQPPNWRWDSVAAPELYPSGWWRVWVVLYSIAGSPWTAPTATCGGGAICGDGTVCGWAGTIAQGQGLVAIARSGVLAGHCQIANIIVSYDATMFDQSLAFGSAKLPDGTWGRNGRIVSNVYVRARPAASVCSFLQGGP